MNTENAAARGDRPPFVVREDGEPVWRCMVGGRVFGDWSQKGPAMAGYKTEKLRRDARAARTAGA